MKSFWLIYLFSFYSQLSSSVLHFCSSNGYFCRFIQQCKVAWRRVDMMTVPSGETDVKTSFSGVPNTTDERSFARKTCGVQSESRNALLPNIGCFRFGDTVPNTRRGSTKRNCRSAWILNCCKTGKCSNSNIFEKKRSIKLAHSPNRAPLNSA